MGTNASREQSCWGQGWIFYKDLYTHHYPLAVISIIPSGFAPVLVFHVFKVFNYSLKTEKRKKNYFEKATENGIMGSKKFWSTVSFIKSFIHNNNITIEIDNKIIEDKSEIAKIFNSHYINMVKSTTGKHPTKLGTLASRISEIEFVATIIDKFKNDKSIIRLKN